MRAVDPEYTRFRTKLIFGYLVLCALLITLLAWKLESGYRLDRKMAEDITRNSAKSMAAHVQELIEAVDQPLRESAQAIAATSSARLSAEVVRPMLSASSKRSDSRFWLVFVDASGRGVVSSNGLPVAGVSFEDRPYFQQMLAASEDNLYVGAPTIGRVSNRRVFFLSRRVESASGKLLGVVAAPVDASRVADVFERARLGPAMSISLATRDAVIVARAPMFEKSFASKLSTASFASRPPPPLTAFEAINPFHGEPTLYSYAPIGDLPLVVVVGVTRESWFARFRSDLAAGALSAASALLIAYLSGRFALNRFRELLTAREQQRALIKDLNTAKAELARGENRLRVIADGVAARVAYVNADQRYTFHNCGKFGAPRGAKFGRTLLETHGSDVYEMIKPDVAKALAGEHVCSEHSHEVDGERRCFKHDYIPDTLPDGRVMGFYATITDITEFKHIQKRLTEIARVDDLTNLPNRAALLDQLEQTLARCRRTKASLACLYLDIDRFKDINDTLGHAGGDAALIEFGRRLRASVRESDTVARLAGDEFVIVLEGVDQPAEAQRAADKITSAMSEPFDIEGLRWTVSASIGVVVADPASQDPRSILRTADEALYKAKRCSHNRSASRAEHAQSPEGPESESADSPG